VSVWLYLGVAVGVVVLLNLVLIVISVAYYQYELQHKEGARGPEGRRLERRWSVDRLLGRSRST
jgi:hypothetical protein